MTGHDEKHALVIDADPIQSEHVRRVLQGQGVSATIATSAADGLAQAMSTQPDLIVVASELPDRSGFGVCRQLRRDPDLQAISTLLISRDIPRSTLERHSRFRSRADGYLMTPFSGFELWRRAGDLLAEDTPSDTPAGRLISGGSGPSVLLIDPDEDSVGPLRQLLRKRHCEPIIAASGVQGLSLCEQRRPDLVIVSLELKSGSGFNVCKKLRRHPTLSNVPIFLMSAEATPEVFANHQKLRSRADVYLRKPFEVQSFWQEVERFLPLAEPKPEGPISIG